MERLELRQHLIEEGLDPVGIDRFIGFLFGENVPDNWKHRIDNMRCKGCMWFVGKGLPGLDKIHHNAIGRCRRHSPTLSGWPVMYDSDWCGDHKLDESKI